MDMMQEFKAGRLIVLTDRADDVKSFLKECEEHDIHWRCGQFARDEVMVNALATSDNDLAFFKVGTSLTLGMIYDSNTDGHFKYLGDIPRIEYRLMIGRPVYMIEPPEYEEDEIQA